MTDEQLDAIRARCEAQKSRGGLVPFWSSAYEQSMCDAHALLAEVDRLRGQLADSQSLCIDRGYDKMAMSAEIRRLHGLLRAAFEAGLASQANAKDGILSETFAAFMARVEGKQ